MSYLDTVRRRSGAVQQVADYNFSLRLRTRTLSCGDDSYTAKASATRSGNLRDELWGEPFARAQRSVSRIARIVCRTVTGRWMAAVIRNRRARSLPLREPRRARSPTSWRWRAALAESALARPDGLPPGRLARYRLPAAARQACAREHRHHDPQRRASSANAPTAACRPLGEGDGRQNGG